MEQPDDYMADLSAVDNHADADAEVAADNLAVSNQADTVDNLAASLEGGNPADTTADANFMAFSNMNTAPSTDKVGGNHGGTVSAALEQMQRYFEARVKDLEEETNRLRQRLIEKPVINVTVSAPSTPARLKTFTGLPPTGNGEVTFAEWEVQTEQLLKDESAVNVEQRIRSTLKGLAWEQAKNCKSARDILSALRVIFGPAQTADDLYQNFQEIKINKKETVSAFLLRLWSELNTINRVTKFTAAELQCKLYRTFLRGLCPNHQMLSLELRTKFGMPGAVSPNLSELLRTVRQLEESGQHGVLPEAQSRVHHAQSLSEADIEKIITGVTQRLQASSTAISDVPVSSATTSTPAYTLAPGHAPYVPPNPRRRQRGPCYRCGMLGHYARECRNTPESTGDRHLNPQQSRVGGNQ